MSMLSGGFGVDTGSMDSGHASFLNKNEGSIDGKSDGDNEAINRGSTSKKVKRAVSAVRPRGVPRPPPIMGITDSKNSSGLDAIEIVSPTKIIKESAIEMEDEKYTPNLSTIEEE